VLDGGPEVLRDIAMATNFGTQFAIIGFVGYNFGCVIASNTMFNSRSGFSGSSWTMTKSNPMASVLLELCADGNPSLGLDIFSLS